MRVSRFIGAAFGLLAASAVAVQADTLDLSEVSRFLQRDSVFQLLGWEALFMAVNYIVNFIFIGFAVMRLGNIAFHKMALDIVFFTLGGQFADHAGAIVTRIVVGSHGFEPIGWAFIAASFAFSGVAIAVLTLLFSHWRWHLSLKARWAVLALAVIFTNPAYVMFSGGSQS
jgi:hypothetical protein